MNELLIRYDIPTLAVIVPCYNEEAVLPKTLAKLTLLLEKLENEGKIKKGSILYFIDDGSSDSTWKLLKNAARKHLSVVAMRLSRNFGHQNALYAGLCQAKEDIIVSIDADLQDGPENIENMIYHYLRGNDVVYGVRSKRKTDTLLKRLTAESYYRLMKKIGVDIIFNHADFRLLSNRALKALLEYQESNIFLRGMVCKIGFKSEIVEYERTARESGESKYSFRKMLSLAWNGITAFSAAPLRVITMVGLISSILTLMFIVWVFAVKIFTDNAIPGWASILIPLSFIGSVQLLCLGVIGEYLSKTYEEVKRRPKFHIDKIVNGEPDES